MIADPEHIAVVSVNRNKYSETFIQKSFVAFEGATTLLYGGYLPTHFTNDHLVEGKIFPAFSKRFFWQKEIDPATQAKQNLIHWLKENRVDCVLAHYGPSGLAMMDICLDLKIPLIVHFHGYDAYRRDILEEQGKSYPALFEKAAAIVVVSEHMKAQLGRLGAPAKKLHLLHYGIDTAFWEAKPMSDASPKFLFVGRFVPKKGPQLVVKAFAKTKIHYEDASLTMIGEGELLAECKDLAAQLGIADAVEFKGACSAETIRQAIWDCRALVLPSQTSELGDSEGTPLVILEAGACGRPVIGTRHGGIVDVIANGENGILIDEGALDDLSNAMHDLADDIARARQMGEDAQAIIRQKFEAKEYHKGLYELCVAVTNPLYF